MADRGWRGQIAVWMSCQPGKNQGWAVGRLKSSRCQRPEEAHRRLWDTKLLGNLSQAVRSTESGEALNQTDKATSVVKGLPFRLDEPGFVPPSSSLSNFLSITPVISMCHRSSFPKQKNRDPSDGSVRVNWDWLWQGTVYKARHLLNVPQMVTTIFHIV